MAECNILLKEETRRLMPASSAWRLQYVLHGPLVDGFRRCGIAVGGALGEDECGCGLFDLARAAQQELRPSLQRFLDAITGAPTWVRNERMDFIAANPLGRALYASLLAEPVRPANNARFMFLNPEARTFFPDWDRGADDIVAVLRGYAGRKPHDKNLSDLIGELATRSDAQNVRFHRTGIRRIHHPVVGDIELSCEAMELPANPGWTMFAYTAEPGSPSDERLKLLASWAATTTSELPAPATLSD